MDQREAWNLVYRQQGRVWRGVSDVAFPFAPGDSVLDVGCGNGKSSAALIAAGFKVTGVDFSEEAVDRCSAQVAGMRCVCASATSLPFSDGEFDGVVMIHILEHLTQEETETAVSEAVRVLRPGGKILVRSFSKDDLRSSEEDVIKGNGIRYRYFSEIEIRDMFSGLSVLSLSADVRTTKFGGTRSRIGGAFQKT